jgi:hypothetical protein
MWYDDVKWIHLVQCRVIGGVLVNMVINLVVPYKTTASWKKGTRKTEKKMEG